MNKLFSVVIVLFTLNPAARADSSLATLKFLVSPSAETASGVAFVQQPVVEMIDKNGNLLPNDSACVVSLGLEGGDRGDTLMGSSLSAVMVNGQAIFYGLRVIRSLESEGPMRYKLVATPSGPCEGMRGDGPFESETFTITTAGLPNHLVLKQAPGNARLGEVWSRQPVLAVVDSDGNLVTSDNSTVVTVRTSEDSPRGILSGTISVAVTNGIASFSDLYIYGGDQSDNSVGTYEYIFEAINPGIRLAGATIGGQVISK